jgi:hypothetical protein
MLHVLTTLQAALTQERDQLLAEKEGWKGLPEATEAKAGKEDWEGEKAELVKNRDEAVALAKVQSLPILTEPRSHPCRSRERRQKNSKRQSVVSGCLM